MARYSGNGVFRISDETYNEIEEWIQAAESVGSSVQYGIQALAELLAYTNMAFAQELSAGFVDPQARNPDAAWQIPVRRITSQYFKGWKVRRVAAGTWALMNETREAYFIEFGINHVGHTKVITYKGGKAYLRVPRRVRRPIQKLSLMKTMNFAEQTDASGRIWSQIFAPFQPGRRMYGSRAGGNRAGQFVGENVQSPSSGMGYL